MMNLSLISKAKRISRKTKARRMSRLQAAREPSDASSDLLDNHPGEPLMTVKFRETETLREKAGKAPTTVTLRELRIQACLFFQYEIARAEEVKLGYPQEGIGLYDQDSDSVLTNLETEEDWDKARVHWNSGASDRRKSNLVQITRLASRLASNKASLPVDVLLGVRDLFKCTSVAANVRSLELLGRLREVEQVSTTLLSTCVAQHAAAAAHLHWHLAFQSQGYRLRFTFARQDGHSGLQAEAALAAALELEEQVFDEIDELEEHSHSSSSRGSSTRRAVARAAAAAAGDGGARNTAVRGLAKKLHSARRSVWAAEVQAGSSAREASTTLKLLRNLRLALGFRRRRLTPPPVMALQPQQAVGSPSSSSPSSPPLLSFGEFGGRSSSGSGGSFGELFSAEDVEERERGALRIQGLRRMRKAKRDVERKRRRAKESLVAGTAASSGHHRHHHHHHKHRHHHHKRDGNDDGDDDDDDSAASTKSSNSAHSDASSHFMEQPHPNQMHQIHTLWTAGALSQGAKVWHRNAAKTLKEWNSAVQDDPRAHDLLLALTLGGLWMNLRCPLTRRIRGVEVAKACLELCASKVPTTAEVARHKIDRANRAMQEKQRRRGKGLAAVAESSRESKPSPPSSPSSGAPPSPDSTGTAGNDNGGGGEEEEGEVPEALLEPEDREYRKCMRRLPGLAAHLLCFLVVADEAVRRALSEEQRLHTLAHVRHLLDLGLSGLGRAAAAAGGSSGGPGESPPTPPKPAVSESVAGPGSPSSAGAANSSSNSSSNSMSNARLLSADEARAVAFAGVTIVARLTLQAQTRDYFPRRELELCLASCIDLAVQLDFHAPAKPNHRAYFDADHPGTSGAKEGSRWRKQQQQQQRHVRMMGGGGGGGGGGNGTHSSRGGGGMGGGGTAFKVSDEDFEQTVLVAIWGLAHALQTMPDEPTASDLLLEQETTQRRSAKKLLKQAKEAKAAGTNPSKHRASMATTSVSMDGVGGGDHGGGGGFAEKKPLPHPALLVAGAVDVDTAKPNSCLGTLLHAMVGMKTGKKQEFSFGKGASEMFKRPNPLDRISVVCGWTKEHNYSAACQRASVAVLAVCCAAAPGQVALRLGVPGLTRLLMYALGLFTSTHPADAKLKPGQGHYLHLQEVGVASLGHLSKAAAAAAKGYKPSKHGGNGNHSFKHHRRGTLHQGGSRPASPKSSSPNTMRERLKLSQKGSAKEGMAGFIDVATAAVEEKSIYERLVVMFRRFVEENKGVERLSSLRRGWELRVALMFEARNELQKSHGAEIKVGGGGKHHHHHHRPEEQKEENAGGGKEKKKATGVASAFGSNEKQRASGIASAFGSVHSSGEEEPGIGDSLDGDNASHSSSSSSSSSSGSSVGAEVAAMGEEELAYELSVYRGMINCVSVLIVNLSTLPPETVSEGAAPVSSSAGATEPPSPKATLSASGAASGAASRVTSGGCGSRNLSGAAAAANGGDGKGDSSPISLTVGAEISMGLKQRSERGRLNLRKLKGAVFPREKVKTVVEMLWSDRRCIAEQGCSALWLLARDPSPRAVIVDLCLQSAATAAAADAAAAVAASTAAAAVVASDGGGGVAGTEKQGQAAAEGVGMTGPVAPPERAQRAKRVKRADREEVVMPIVPRLLSLLTATPVLSLRTWAVSAFWILLEDERFRNQPGDLIEARLVPLLQYLVCTYGPMGHTATAARGGIEQKLAAVAERKARRRLRQGKNRHHHGHGSGSVSGDSSSSSSSSSSESDDDDHMNGGSLDSLDIGNNGTNNAAAGSGGAEGDDRDLGMDGDERKAANWNSADLRTHCERQRLAGVSLGALVCLAHHHLPTREALRTQQVPPALPDMPAEPSGSSGAGGAAPGDTYDGGEEEDEFLFPNRRPSNQHTLPPLELVLVELIERKATVGQIKKLAFHLLFLLCNSNPQGMARLQEAEKLHQRHLHLRLREHQPTSPGYSGDGDGDQGNANSDGCNDGGGSAAMQKGTGGAGTAARSAPTPPSLCQYLEKAALKLLAHPSDPKPAFGADVLDKLPSSNVDKFGRPDKHQGRDGLASAERTATLAKLHENEKVVHALALVEAKVLGQQDSGGAVGNLVKGSLSNDGGSNLKLDAEAMGNGTADEDDAMGEFAMAALVDMTSRRDFVKVSVVDKQGHRNAVRHFRDRPLNARGKVLARVATKGMKAFGGVGVGGDFEDGDDGEDEEEGDNDEGLGEWKRTLPLHLLLNLSSMEACRLKVCVTSFDDLLVVTRTAGLQKRIDGAQMKIVGKEYDSDYQAAAAVSSSSSSSSAHASPLPSARKKSSRRSSRSGSPTQRRLGSPVAAALGWKSDDDDDNGDDADGEDLVAGWGRKLGFATLANLSRSMECRQRIFKWSLEKGLMPPGVHGSTSNPDKNSSTSATTALVGSSSSSRPTGGNLADQSQPAGPPAWTYLSDELVEAMSLMKERGSSSGGGGGATTAGAGGTGKVSKQSSSSSSSSALAMKTASLSTATSATLVARQGGSHMTAGRLARKQNAKSIGQAMQAIDKRKAAEAAVFKTKAKARAAEAKTQNKLQLDIAPASSSSDPIVTAFDLVRRQQEQGPLRHRHRSTSPGDVSATSHRSVASTFDEDDGGGDKDGASVASNSEEHFQSVVGWMFNSAAVNKRPKGAPNRTQVKRPMASFGQKPTLEKVDKAKKAQAATKALKAHMNNPHQASEGLGFESARSSRAQTPLLAASPRRGSPSAPTVRGWAPDSPSAAAGFPPVLGGSAKTPLAPLLGLKQAAPCGSHSPPGDAGVDGLFQLENSAAGQSSSVFGEPSGVLLADRKVGWWSGAGSLVSGDASVVSTVDHFDDEGGARAARGGRKGRRSVDVCELLAYPSGSDPWHPDIVAAAMMKQQHHLASNKKPSAVEAFKKKRNLALKESGHSGVAAPAALSLSSSSTRLLTQTLATTTAGAGALALAKPRTHGKKASKGAGSKAANKKQAKKAGAAKAVDPRSKRREDGMEVTLSPRAAEGNTFSWGKLKPNQLTHVGGGCGHGLGQSQSFDVGPAPLPSLAPLTASVSTPLFPSAATATGAGTPAAAANAPSLFVQRQEVSGGGSGSGLERSRRPGTAPQASKGGPVVLSARPTSAAEASGLGLRSGKSGGGRASRPGSAAPALGGRDISGEGEGGGGGFIDRALIDSGVFTGGHSVSAPPLEATSGRIWMWPHVNGSKVSFQSGLVPFKVTEGQDHQQEQGAKTPTNGDGGNSNGAAAFSNDVAAGVAGGADYADHADEGDEDPSKDVAAPKGFHFFHRSNVSAVPFPSPPLPPPLPPTDLGRIFQTSLPAGEPPLVPSPDGNHPGEGDSMVVGAWARVLDVGHMAAWTSPPPWLLALHEPSELVNVRVGDTTIQGGVGPSPLFFLSEAPVFIEPPTPEAVVAVVEKQTVRPPEWKLETSIWETRPTMNDGKGFMNNGDLYKKALNRDWRRLMNEERFFRFVDREDAGGQLTKEGQSESVEDELEEVKEVLFAWAGPLLRMFDFYCLHGACSSNSNDNSAFAVSENAYHGMCIDLKLVDKRKCTKSFLSNVFVQVNVEADDGKAGGEGPKEAKAAAKLMAAQNFVNEDRALMRFEFIEAIARIAVCKYKEDAGGDVSEALEILMHNHVDPFFCHRGESEAKHHPQLSASGSVEKGSANGEEGSVEGGESKSGSWNDSNMLKDLKSGERLALPEVAYPMCHKESQTLFSDPNIWRTKTLYHKSVDDCLKSHQNMLEMVYSNYSKYDIISRGGITQKSKTAEFTLQCWMDFLEDCKILMSSKNQAPWGRQLTQRDARLAFFLSRFTVVDEVKHRGRTMSLDKLEFFECLCRCAELMSEELPLASDLAEKGRGSGEGGAEGEEGEGGGGCGDLILYEWLLNKEGKVVADREKRVSILETARRQSGIRKSMRKSLVAAAKISDRDSEDDGNLSDVSEGGSDDERGSGGRGGAGAADLQKSVSSSSIHTSARTQLMLSRRLHERVDMFLRLIGGRLGMKFQGQMQVGKQFLRFVPKYIADQSTYKLS